MPGMSESPLHLSHPVPGRSNPPRPPVSQCVVSFGSNLGERRELISLAARKLAESNLVLGDVCDEFPNEPGGLRTSRLFETPPIGGPGGQEPFLNAIGVFQTVAPARGVLDFLQELELELGRQRRLRWGARSIDLDVVLHGNLVGGATGLVVPHPRYTARQFVLLPACDVASHFRDPRFGWTLGELTEHLSRQPPSLALVSGSDKLRQHLCERVHQDHGIQIARPEDQPFRFDCPWVSAFLPELPLETPLSQSSDDLRSRSIERVASDGSQFPRLVVRLHRTSDTSQWPAPHLMWPGGWRWPEYRLEIDDLDWSVSELASAIDSMRCEVTPVTSNGHWW